MVAVAGTYKDGKITLEKEFVAETPVKVIVTFLEDVQPAEEKYLSLSDFSFAKSRKALEDFKGSFSDEVIKERRSYL